MAAKDRHTEGRLRSRPAAEPPGEASPVGLLRLGLNTRRDHLLYVPASYRLGHLAPLVVLLHGAGANSRDIMPYLRDLAGATGLILLASTSREYTWDVIVGGYGPDVEDIDRALEETFSRYAVDPGRIAVGASRTGPPTRSPWGSQTGTCSDTSWRSRPASWPRQQGGLPTRLRLPRHARRGTTYRPLQPQDRPRARACRIRRQVPRVRGRPHGPTRYRMRGRGLVRCGAGPKVGAVNSPYGSV